MKSAKRRRVDVNLDELDRVLDGARKAPLSEADCDKLKSALHALAAMLAPPRNTEKTSAVLEEPKNPETGDGAQPDTEVGDLFMTLIHTCQLCGANSFDYLTELQRHARELTANPAEWMPWNYRERIGRAEV